MLNIMNKKNKYIKILLLLVLFINCCLVSLILHTGEYLYDAKWYWTIADPVFSGGHFDLMNFPESFRGCLYPLMICFFKHMIPGHKGWLLISAFMTTIMFGCLLPSLFGIVVDNIRSSLKILVSQWLFFFFWGDFLQYPMSDFAAPFFLLLAIWLINSIQFEKDNNSDLKKLKQILVRFFLITSSGACLYISYNIRATYLYADILVVLFFCFKQRRNKLNVIYALVIVLLGAFIISIPQCIVNSNYIGKYSPKVYTEQYTGYGTSLQARQVFWGLELQRYETYIGDLEDYSSAGVYFNDMTGMELIHRENLERDSFEIKWFFILFFKYPLDMIGIYTRHLVNLMTPSWNQLYIDNLFNNKNVLVVVSMIIWFIAGIAFYMNVQEKTIPKGRLYLMFSVMLPGFLQLIGAPELRFFLMIYLILYTYVFVEIDYSHFVRYVWKNWKVILPITVLIFMLWVSILGSTLADNRENQMLINDAYIESER